MSNVIKGYDLIMAHPKIIDSSYLEVLDAGEEQAISSIKAIDIEKEELEKLKQESQEILTETEDMVMELLEKARNEARSTINDAQEEVEVIRAQAYEEADNIRKRAREEGYQTGLKQAHNEIEADRQLALEQSRQLVEEARQTKLRIMESIETDIVRLVMAVAKKLVASELTANPNIIVNIVRQAISFLDNPQNVTVYVNSQDMDELLSRVQKQELAEVGSDPINIEVRCDDRIEKGGCLVDSEIGRVDAQVHTRIASVEGAIQEVINNE